ncbi:MAG: hypothetical protein K2Q22_08310, partial [Cytophagales bacterium]|nr:hypothetical protein [Cytophagales bacterium]
NNYLNYLDTTIKTAIVSNSTFKNVGYIGQNTGLMKWSNNTMNLINNSNNYGSLARVNVNDSAAILNSVGAILLENNIVVSDAPKDGKPAITTKFLSLNQGVARLNMVNNTFTNINRVVKTWYFAGNTFNTFGYNPSFPDVVPNLIKGNRFVNCDTAVIYTGSEPYVFQYNVGQIPQNLSVPNACNTYTTNKANSVGVLLNAQVANNYTIGTPTAPAGNNFSGYDGVTSFGVYNQGQDFTYYLGQNEDINLLKTGGSGQVTKRQLIGINSNCSGQGYSNGVGRLAMSETQDPNVKELQDSVRFKGSTASRIKLFQSEITKYYVNSNNLDSLGLYTQSLVNCNREAYYSFCLYLINKYTAMGNATKATIWKSYARQPNPNDQEINARISYLELLQNRPELSVNKSSGFLPNGNLLKYRSTDSTNLANLANSGTSVAEGALGLLRIAYPRFTCNTGMRYNYRMYDTLNCNTEFAYARRALEEDNLTNKLWDAVPNPANDGTSIAYQIIDKNSLGYLEVFELSTGLKLQTIKLNERMAKASIVLDLKNYKSGVYGYRFIVDEKVLTVKKLVVIK